MVLLLRIRHVAPLWWIGPLQLRRSLSKRLNAGFITYLMSGGILLDKNSQVHCREDTIRIPREV
jgi:hypothetical protein